MAPPKPVNPERSFGISVGGVLCLLAVVFAWRGRVGRAEVLAGLGVALVALGVAAPTLLKWPSAVWWRLAHVLGYVNTRVILTVLFALIFVPLGTLWRIIGRDPLSRRRDRWPGWSAYPARYRDRRHYARMY